MSNDLVPTPSISELARQFGVSRTTIRRRLATGWTPTIIDGEIVEQGQSVSTPSRGVDVQVDSQVDATMDAPSDVQVDGKMDNIVRLPMATAPMARLAVQKVAPATSHKSPVARLDAISPAAPSHLHERVHGSRWRAIGRGAVGLGIVGTGAFIAYTSMRANAWFGYSLTPDPVAGEVYARLSVAAEVIACLIPTGIRFYFQTGEVWSAVRGWALMTVALVVVFFAAGGFAITNINSGIEARVERETPATRDLRAQIVSLDKSIAGECAKRGDRCRELERQRAEANAKLGIERASLKADADPQAAVLGVNAATLHLVQAGAMVALCLFSGLFISFGAGLIWPNGQRAA